MMWICSRMLLVLPVATINGHFFDFDQWEWWGVTIGSAILIEIAFFIKD